MTDHTWASNDLTNFESEEQAMNGNGSYVIQHAETCLEKLVKSL